MVGGISRMRRWLPGLLLCLAVLGAVPESWAQITRTAFPNEFWNAYSPLTTRTTPCNAATLNTALGVLGSLNRVLWLPPIDGANASCTWTIDGNVTIPANITLYVPDGVQVAINAGATLTINGPFVAGERQVFSSVLGTLVFGSRTQTLHALWWGETRNATTLNAALTSIGSAVKTLTLGGGDWTFATNVTTLSTTTLLLPAAFSCSIAGGAVLQFAGPVLDMAHGAKGIGSNVTVGNTVTETGVVSYTVSGCSMSLHHGIRLFTTWDYLNDSGANTTLTIRVTYGGNTILSFVTTELEPNALRRPASLEVLLFTAGSATATRAYGSFKIGGPYGVTGQSASTFGEGLETVSGHNNITTDSTANVPLTITAQHGTAHASVSITMQSTLLELLQK